MIRKFYNLLLLILLFPICSYAGNPDIIGIKSTSDIGRNRLTKLSGVKRDTMNYRFPFLTFHFGASAAFTEGNMIVNPGNEESGGSNINFENDLGFNKAKIFPRVNVYLRLGNRLLVIFDLYTLRRKETKNLGRDIQFGNVLFPEGTRVESRFFLASTILAYRHSFITRPHFDIGGIIGGAGLYYRLKMEQENEAGLTHKESVFLPVPIIGLDAMTFITQDLYLRAVTKFSWSPINNYEYLLWSFRPYLEYYFLKNVGIGVKYHFSYNKIRDLSSDDFNGKFNYEFHAVSLVATWRIM